MLFFSRKKLKNKDAERQKILHEFERRIGYRFKDINLLNTALCHPSYLHENQIKDQEHYERMEFLGDSVLGLIVCEHIYEEFPHYNEGGLSDIKSHVVSEKQLVGCAKRLDLGKYILFGAGEARTGGRRKSSILANVFEAVLGAIFLDGGFQKAKDYLLRHAKEDIIIHPPERESSNYKGILQKYCQTYFAADPHYRVVAEKGPSHSRRFEIEVWAKERKLGGADGRSKKDAEQRAAANSIRYFENAEFKKHLEGSDEGSKKRKTGQGHPVHETD
ncbi:MAG: ribonuclease III [Nitrospinae bacterium]|nr:ribonuclease III [Nitrospinota bacterium]